jgi:hypothetical protein
LKWKNSFFLLIAIWQLFCCDIINLEQIQYSTFPAEREAIVGETDLRQPIWIEFSITPNKTSAEDLFLVTSTTGNQNGDFSWQGNRLYFTPVPQWQKARRYVFSFNGELQAEDGRSFDIRCTVPFYAGEKGNLPELMGVTPQNGETVDVGTALILTFSQPIDQESFIDEFSLAPNTDYERVWDPTGTIVIITPEDQWNNLTQYNWHISDKLESTDGVKVVQSYSGSFLTQVDDTAPLIQSITAAAPDWITPFPDRAPPDLNNLCYKDAIKIAFSEPGIAFCEPVNYQTVQGAFHIEPSVVGFIHEIIDGADTYYVFLPEEGYVMDQLYHLTIDNTVEDLAGNKMLQNEERWFKPGGIKPIVISDIVLVADSKTITTFNSPVPISINVVPAEGRYVFQIHFDPAAFSGFTDPDVQSAVAQAISCTQIAPTTFGLSIYSINWPNDHTLDIGFKGFLESTATKIYRYKIVIPGGATGIVNENGSRLTEDIFIYLEEDGP